MDRHTFDRLLVQHLPAPPERPGVRSVDGPLAARPLPGPPRESAYETTVVETAGVPARRALRAVLAALRTAPDPPTAALLAQFEATLVERRWAAAALGGIGDAATLGRPNAMTVTGVHRREALAGLIASETPKARQMLARLADDPAAGPHVTPVRGSLKFLFPS